MRENRAIFLQNTLNTEYMSQHSYECFEKFYFVFIFCFVFCAQLKKKQQKKKYDSDREIQRRQEDFEWLHQKLLQTFGGKEFVPALPQDLMKVL